MTTTATMATPKELKERNEEITLCVNMTQVDEIGFVTSMSHPMHHQGCKCVAQNDEDTFHQVSDEMSQMHNEGGHRIKTIKCDQEFQSIVEAVADDLGVNMNCTNAQDHMAAAEQNNCTIKESM